jgi:hypothetical protein
MDRDRACVNALFRSRRLASKARTKDETVSRPPLSFIPHPRQTRMRNAWRMGRRQYCAGTAIPIQPRKGLRDEAQRLLTH